MISHLQFLWFVALTVPTTHFDFEASPLWKDDDFDYIVPYDVASNREGVWIKSQNFFVGFLYGISLDYFSTQKRESTYLVLLSESLDARGGIELQKTSDNLSNNLILHFGQKIEYFVRPSLTGPKSTQGSDPGFEVLNVMAITKIQEGLYERVAVGQINASAWRSGQPYDMEVILR